jgi:hypothetical protein
MGKRALDGTTGMYFEMEYRELIARSRHRN